MVLLLLISVQNAYVMFEIEPVAHGYTAMKWNNSNIHLILYNMWNEV